MLDMPGSEKDATGLGRWTTMLSKGDGVQTWMVCEYNPCKNKRTDSRTSYQQQQRFLIMHKQDHRTCPQAKFREDLLHLLPTWWVAGDCIVMWLDANKDIYKMEVRKALTDLGMLGTKEVMGAYMGKKIGPTFFWGQLPIDGIWATPEVTISNACIMLAGYGIGDHRLFVIDIHTSMLIGTGLPRVQWAALRWLNTRLPHVALKYAKNLEENIQQHHLIEKLGEAHTLGTNKEDTQWKINLVDKEGKPFMTHAECARQKLKLGRIFFSPKLVIWLKREQIHHLLMEYKLGCNKNQGSQKWAACIQKIKPLLNLDGATQEILGELWGAEQLFPKTCGPISQETPAKMGRAGKGRGQGGGGCKKPGHHKMQAGLIILASSELHVLEDKGRQPNYHASGRTKWLSLWACDQSKRPSGNMVWLPL